MPIISSNIYYQDRNDWYPRAFTLWVEHPKLLVAVVMPRELGLWLSHLRLVLDQEEGAIDALGSTLHVGNQIFYSPTFSPSRLCSFGSVRAEPRVVVQRSSGRFTRSCYLSINRLGHNINPLHWGGGHKQIIIMLIGGGHNKTYAS